MADRLGGDEHVPAGEQALQQAAEQRVRRRDRQRFSNHQNAWRVISRSLQRWTRYTLGDTLTRPLRTIRVAQNIPNPYFDYFTVLFPRINDVFERIYHDEPWVEQMMAITRDIEREAPRPPGLVIPDEPPAPVPRPVGPLARFASDRQNVHTTESVNMTKRTIEKVLAIPVPKEYQSPNIKTMVEVLASCPFDKRSARHFSDKYCLDENIYEYGGGIYARVTDAVWQFILKSPHKADLCRIFATEVKDGIAMCAQGNLTRLCNVLSGYMDGLVVESTGEQLQRRMAELSTVADETVRLAQGRGILRELAVPEVQWQPWLDALA